MNKEAILQIISASYNPSSVPHPNTVFVHVAQGNKSSYPLVNPITNREQYV